MTLYSFGIDLLVWGDIGWLVSLHRKLGRRHERMEWQRSLYNKKKETWKELSNFDRGEGRGK